MPRLDPSTRATNAGSTAGSAPRRCSNRGLAMASPSSRVITPSQRRHWSARAGLRRRPSPQPTRVPSSTAARLIQVPLVAHQKPISAGWATDGVAQSGQSMGDPGAGRFRFLGGTAAGGSISGCCIAPFDWPFNARAVDARAVNP